MTKKHLTDQKFNDLNLIEPLKQGIADAGFEYCTPIQASSLPIALAGKDVAGQAQTGTGKTVAFLLACCQHLVNNKASEERKSNNVRALILDEQRVHAFHVAGDHVELRGEVEPLARTSRIAYVEHMQACIVRRRDRVQQAVVSHG